MTRVVILLLVVAVAILAWRDRQRERRLAQVEASVNPIDAPDRIAPSVAPLRPLISDPLRRHKLSLSEIVISCERFRRTGTPLAFCSNIDRLDAESRAASSLDDFEVAHLRFDKEPCAPRD